MTKSASSNPPSESVRSIPYNGDLYNVYHINGIVTGISVCYDNVSARPTPIEWEDLPPRLQQLIDDTINLGSK